MTPFTAVESKLVPLLRDDIDTDQIIPARFLKGTEKRGLGAHLFADWRTRAGFPLLEPEAKGAEILLAGRNFGCGSSREHAPWALADFGFRAVIARSFADIFRQNALKNGLLPVALDDASHAKLALAREANPGLRVRVDLAAQVVTLPGEVALAFQVDPFARHCLLEGLDELGYVLSFADRIAEYEDLHTG